MSNRAGRNPTPTEVRKRTGNPQHRPMPSTTGGGPDRPKPGQAVPLPAGVPPADRDQWKQAWRDVTQPLVKAGIYAHSDKGAVEVAVGLLVRLRQVRLELSAIRAAKRADRWGKVLPPTMMAPTTRGSMAHPLLTAERELSAQLRLAYEGMGVGAVARTRISNADQGAGSLGALLGDIGTPTRGLRVVGGQDDE